MREDIEHPPIMNAISGVKGFMAGGLMSLSLFTPWDIGGRIFLFIVGFIIFIDAVMPVDRKLYAVTSAFFFLVGGLIGLFTGISGSGVSFLALIILISVLVYLDKIRRMRSYGKMR